MKEKDDRKKELLQSIVRQKELLVSVITQLIRTITMTTMTIVFQVLRHRENEERRRGAVEQAVTDLLTR